MTSIPTDLTTPVEAVEPAGPAGPAVPGAPARPARPCAPRPPDRRDARRPAGRARPAVLPSPRPAVGGGGCGVGPVVPRAVALRRRRVAAGVVLAGLLAGLLTAVVLLAGPSGAAGASGPVPDRVAVTVVGRGETLSDVARRSAPAAEVSATVERIRALNDLPDSGLSVGRPLTVPVG